MTIIDARLADILTRPVLKGAHPPDNGMCVAEMAAYLAGEAHSDQPQCVCPVIRAFVVRWNDDILDDDTRTRLLRPYIARIVDTRSTKAVEQKRADLALDWFIRVQTPAWLDLSPTLQPHAAAIRALAPVTSLAALQAAQPTLNAARSAAAAARDAAGAAARDAAWYAAGNAAWYAAGNAAWYAAGAAARDAAWYAAGAAARDAAGAAAGDAAWAALQPTVAQLQVSALELLDKMIAMTHVEATR